MIEGELYLKNNLEGMNNDELILFIYQQMLKILNQTSYYFEKNDIENRVNGINKAIEILNALMSILNFEAGGEIASRLRSLYLYSIKRLTTANYEKDPQPVEEVIRIFKGLHSGWAEKIENDKKNNVKTGTDLGNPINSNRGSIDINRGGQGLEIYG
jgi:flagellar protein FliS